MSRRPLSSALLWNGTGVRDRAVVLFAVLAILSSMLAYTAAQPRPALSFGDLHHFTFASIGNQVAGVEFVVNVEARDVDEELVTTYSGTPTPGSDLGNSPNDDDPSLAIGTFVGGVAVVTVTAYKAETGRTLSLDDGEIHGTSDPFDVAAAALASITIAPDDESITADEQQSFTAEGFDQYGNSLGDVTDDTTFSIGVPGACLADACWSRTVPPSSYTVTGTDTFVDTASLTVTPGALDHFAFDAIDPQVAGAPFDVTVTAYDQWDNVKTDYDGTAVPSGLNDSPGCLSCDPDLDSESPEYGDLEFTNGVATTSVTAYEAAETATLIVTDSLAEVDDGSAPFVVSNAEALEGFSFAAVGTRTAGTQFEVMIRAHDLYGNLNTDYEGPSVLGGLSDSPGCGQCLPVLGVEDPDYSVVSWDDGIASADVTAFKARTGATLTVEDSGADVSSSTSFDVDNAAALKGFTINAIGVTQVAGAPFPVTITAYDLYGNVNKGYDDGAFSGLAPSPGCPVPSCPTTIAPTPGTYGSGGFIEGVLITSVTAFNSQILASLNFADVVADVGRTSNTFTVIEAAVSRLLFADAAVGFNGQPIDTKVNQPINSVCGPYVPPPPTPPANPCAAATSTGTKVIAIDAYGNRVAGVSVTMTTTPSISPPADFGGTKIQTTHIGTPGVAPRGEAVFGNLTIKVINAPPALNQYTFTAGASGATDGISRAFTVVNDLEACDNQLCDNQANTGTGGREQRAFGKITTTGANDFFTGTNNVILTTKFVDKSMIIGRCGSNGNIGDSGTELTVQGLGVSDTKPGTLMVFIIPKDTLKTFKVQSRGTTSFNVCLGALWIDAGAPTADRAPWRGKIANGSPDVWADPYPSDNEPNRYWGTPADCGTTGLRATDPCILLRTKQASTLAATLGMTTAQVSQFFKDADVAIVVKKPFPWDGRGGGN